MKIELSKFESRKRVASIMPLQQRGFTLIELLLVITILGILLGIAVLGFSGADRLSTIKSCRVDILSVQTAVSSYKNDYPEATSLGGALTNPDLYASASTPGTLANLGYLIPLNDFRAKYTVILQNDLNVTVTSGNLSIQTKCLASE